MEGGGEQHEKTNSDFEEELEVERVEEKKVYRRVVKFIEIKKKQKFKMNHIFVRVLTFLFILLPISILWYTDKYIQVKSDSNNAGKSAFEVIFLIQLNLSPRHHLRKSSRIR